MLKLTTSILAVSAVAALFVSNPLLAKEQSTLKTIEIKAIEDQDVNVLVEADGQSQTVHISADELADAKALEAKLGSLDEETRSTVMDALQGLISGETGEREIEKVMVLNKDENKHVVFIEDDSTDMDVEILADGKRKIIRKHIIRGEGTDSTIKGHSDTIIKLIQHGKFSQEELDKIQAALDSKR